LKRRNVLAFFQKVPSCLVGMEACATSHHWSREQQALGHTVRLMPPAYVKSYVKRQKNDATDAEAICEAVSRANMRFVATKTPEQQSGLMLHRTRHLFIRQQRTGSAVSASKVTVICPACSQRARLLSFAMPRSMAPSIGRRTGRSGNQDNPLSPMHCRMRAIDRDLIREGHYGQRSCEPRKNRPNTWLHRPMLQTFKKVLANSEPSTHGGKADIIQGKAESRNVRL
jgi:hypothetical protein